MSPGRGYQKLSRQPEPLNSPPLPQPAPSTPTPSSPARTDEPDGRKIYYTFPPAKLLRLRDHKSHDTANLSTHRPSFQNHRDKNTEVDRKLISC